MSYLDLIHLNLLGNDLYLTFRARYQDCDVIAKYFTDASDNNNEYKVLTFLQTIPERDRFPKPVFQEQLSGEITITYENDKIITVDAYKVIVYQYLPGNNLQFPLGDEEIMNCRRDIVDQLKILHKYQLVYGDVNTNNIIYWKGKYCLIDYGRCFSLVNTDMPPLEYMIEDETIPTMNTDLLAVNNLGQK